MKRQRLGQHYLVDKDAVRRVVEFASIRPSERVLEIGTGKGALTRELAGKGSALVGYELDPSNLDETREAVRGTGAEIRLGDAFEARPEFDVLVSSLPYSESATFVEWLCGLSFNRAVVVLQADFVRKLLAPPGDREYRGISALAQIAFDVKVLDRIGRASFSPQPRVNSVIASFTPRRRLPREEVANVIRLFSLRRRQVGSALAKLRMKEKGAYGRRRVYELGPEEVHELCRHPGPE
jgi:16S rRNA A1518/A1519 N6-dimethyltransferase RsmA/KsgA/DIM1 with predicted DNA glycosylase/AP lyase activity